MVDSEKNAEIRKQDLESLAAQLFVRRSQVNSPDSESMNDDVVFELAQQFAALSLDGRKPYLDEISLTLSDLSRLGYSITKLVDGDDQEIEGYGPQDRIHYWRSAAKRALDQGRPIEAYDVASEGLGKFPGDLPLIEYYARALQGAGAAQRSLDVLKAVDESERTDETKGLIASAQKRLALAEPNASKRVALFGEARDQYLAVYRSNSKHYWTGINAAALSVLTNDQVGAKSLASEVALVAESAKDQEEDKYWAEATLAETYLIRGDLAEAKKNYRSAANRCSNDFSRIASTLKNAQLLSGPLGYDKKELASCFRIPSVIVFSGHMLDAKDREPSRFPSTSEAVVRAGIRESLQKHESIVAYSSAACGADLIFLEEVLKLNGEINIVLPFDRETFAKFSVENVGGVDWKRKFDHVLDQADSITVLTDRHPDWETVAYDFTNRIILGKATLRAERLLSEVVGLAVWDLKQGGGLGGTGSAVDIWRSTKIGINVVDPMTGAPVKEDKWPEEKEERHTEELQVGIKSMIFADFSGFSKLREVEIPQFAKHALGLVAELIKEFGLKEQDPIAKNTWGDGLYLVFDEVRDAGLFALELVRRVEEIHWPDYGLPEELALRIGLHAGPVYRCIDPVTGNLNFIGTNVSRTARIEPITPEGEVYASGAFAELVAAEELSEFDLLYVGKTPLAKNYGAHRLYHVTARR